MKQRDILYSLTKPQHSQPVRAEAKAAKSEFAF